MSYSQHATPTDNTPDTLIVLQSYAKINLTLDVLGRRADGYHELATVMQTVDLYDTISLRTRDDDQVTISCTRPDLNDDGNLLVRAAQAIRQRLGLHRGLAIELHKRIPVAAGLGGGSGNAATALLALKQLWDLPLTLADLHSLAAELGSDVPFFLCDGLALCEGRGERITPIPLRWPIVMRWLLLLKPAISVSTAAVFRHLPPGDYSDGTASRTVFSALQSRSPLSPASLHNSLQRSVLEQYPPVAQAYEDMLRAGSEYVQLSGSGPTLFTSFSELSRAAQVQHQLQTQGYEIYLTRPISPRGQPIHFF